MHIGTMLPQTEIGADPSVLSDFAVVADQSGLDFLDVYEHVVGADTATRPDWDGPYDLDSNFHEPFVVLGFLAAMTERIGLSTSVLVLPQRQTALVAKQAAAADVLSGGRLRLGVGIGWNRVEYDVLGSKFSDRAVRYEEQLELLRLFWTQRSVTYHGTFEHVDAAGIWPMPLQQPIPLWMGGGTATPVLERIGRYGDGWMSTVRPGNGLEEAMLVIRRSAEAAGRDPEAIGVQGGVMVGESVDSDRINRHLDIWQAAGASHVVVTTTGRPRAPQEHVDILASVAKVIAGRLGSS